MTMLRIVRTFYQVLILPLSRFFSSLSKTLDLTYFFNMAGAEGFEPSNAEIKTPCLAAWRRPNKLLT